LTNFSVCFKVVGAIKRFCDVPRRSGASPGQTKWGGQYG